MLMMDIISAGMGAKKLLVVAILVVLQPNVSCLLCLRVK